jgi:hypothetical protein
MLISTALLLDSIIRNSVCTPAKLPCRRVEVGYEYNYIIIRNSILFNKYVMMTISRQDEVIICVCKDAIAYDRILLSSRKL